MTRRSLLLDLYGMCSALHVIGKRNKATQSMPDDVSCVAFWERDRLSSQKVSRQEARLSYLDSELLILFEDQAFSQEPLPFVLNLDQETPRLLIGDSAVVTVDGETLHFVFNEFASQTGVIVVTPCAKRLIDHVLYHLTANGNFSGEETANKAAQMLTGQTLADVERRVILQTLRHCHGNRTQAAEMLDVPLTRLRNKLQEYWRADRNSKSWVFKDRNSDV